MAGPIRSGQNGPDTEFLTLLRCRRSIRRPAASAAGCTSPATAETRAQAERAFDGWIERYEDKYPKTTACLARDRELLLAFHDGIEVTEDSRAVA